MWFFRQICAADFVDKFFWKDWLDSFLKEDDGDFPSAHMQKYLSQNALTSRRLSLKTINDLDRHRKYLSAHCPETRYDTIPSFQAQFLIPMAISISFGLLFATLLTLLYAPALYLIIIDIKKLFIRWFNKEESQRQKA